ncbi:MAG: biopolymer transporter ExbD [Candidatus Latescibacteria bacterium]|nr:biopolymer transporter ExbD [Candidatus Latescibacterota bacterium]
MQVDTKKGAISAAINITPLVDVMLVLLIVYMVMVAMIRQGVPVLLPDALNARTTSLENQDKVITLSLNENKEVFVNLKQVDIAYLDRELAIAYQGREGQPVLIKGAKSLLYGDVLQLMNTCRLLGIAGVELVAKKGEVTGTETP